MKGEGALPGCLKGLILSAAVFLLILIICFIQFASAMYSGERMIGGIPADTFWFLLIMLDVCLYTVGIVLLCLFYRIETHGKEKGNEK